MEVDDGSVVALWEDDCRAPRLEPRDNNADDRRHAEQKDGVDNRRALSELNKQRTLREDNGE
jgi:hypothetical protein